MHTMAKSLSVYRLAAGIALAAALLLLWIQGALAESEDSPGLIFVGVIATLILGTLIARFESRGMSLALMATAIAQALVAVYAVINWGQYAELLAFNGFFILLWVGSALLFRRADRLEREADGRGAV